MRTYAELGLVTQLHYQGWPDHGVPDTTETMLILHDIIQEFEVPRCPLVVLSSEGCGDLLSTIYF